MNKVKGVYAFKVKGGPGGQEGLWVVDAKNGSGSVEFGGKGMGSIVVLLNMYSYKCTFYILY